MAKTAKRYRIEYDPKAGSFQCLTQEQIKDQQNKKEVILIASEVDELTAKCFKIYIKKTLPEQKAKGGKQATRTALTQKQAMEEWEKFQLGLQFTKVLFKNLS